MNSIKMVIEELMPGVSNKQKEWIKKLMEHPDIKKLIHYHNISNDNVLASLNLLHQYVEEKENCSKCNNLLSCSNILKGHFTKIYFQNGQFQSSLIKCEKLILKEKEEHRSKLFKSQYIPQEILDASFKNIDPTPGREDALAALMEFCKNFDPNVKQKGIYLYGPLGVGKSHMMVATAKKLAERNISTLMIYVPDFFREIKNSIQDNTLNKKIEILKNVQVLILDDIGAETLSTWERDEILGAILQARMIKGLPTLYTSNLNYDDLEEHLAYSNKGGQELLKSKRLMERIRHYTSAYFVDGPNRRILS
ncbi:hypothetical protein BHF71_03540 [Vulcanibacillus modesticaldus]|uniref:Primosomal protein DnaI n=1 Tax=Vulcanibacillus modesticaldus TaxID=337097 RepID=A0A1D2YSY5_9BACI|nr:primosomal protein DnaI [Vulcanibacillus modesticaldus]OEF98101.1 hypothetical protein BHF71_03540 [Vulcanibacillus modesticaldus]